MPEGDALYRAAQRLQVLVGERVEVEAPNPRAAVKHIAERLDGQRLESVEAVGKNLFLQLRGRRHAAQPPADEGTLARAAARPRRSPAAARGSCCAARRTRPCSGTGRCSSSSDRARRRLGPDILAEPPDLDAMVANLRALPPGTRLGEALQVQRAVAGIGNMWMSEALFEARVSPWLTLAEATRRRAARRARSAPRA